MIEQDRETNVGYLDGWQFASVTTSIRRHISKMKALAEAHPNEVTLIENPDGSIYMQFPPEWLRLPSPPRKRNLSDEQKQAIAQRLAEGRDKKNG